MTVAPQPAAESIRMLVKTNLTTSLWVTSQIPFSGYTFVSNINAAAISRFYQAEITPVTTNGLLTAAALNRIAYGQTPVLLDRLLQNSGANSAQGWINEQLNPGAIVETATNANTNIAWIAARFPALNANNVDIAGNEINNTNNLLIPGTANLADLRAWLVLHAVHGERQLLETLTQFFENLHVTQFAKGRDFMASFYNSFGTVQDRQSTRLEYLETKKRRDALLNPQCTFSNILLIQAESPAMIIYLDTTSSTSTGNNVANENYAREIMELFSMGVDNGYDQKDITEMAPCWTGWQTRFVTNTAQYGNPFATPVNGPYTNSDGTIVPGVWQFVFTPSVHGWSNLFNTNYIFFERNGSGTITGPKTVPARFGAPWVNNVYTNPGAAGGSLGPLGGASVNGPGQYGLFIPPAALNSTNHQHVNDGYAIVKHCADLPFTQEYISYKLCSLFVSDTFKFGPANGYDFRDVPTPPLTNSGGTVFPWYSNSAEGILLKQCMLAWENPSGGGPKGQIYKVLETIFNSDLFRTNGLRSKVKTPFEYTVSAIRALKQNTNGTVSATGWTADTDGYSIAGGNALVSVPLERMGGFGLFDRETPDGYPEYGQAWISAGTLTERVRYVQQLAMGPYPGYTTANTNKNDGLSSGNPAGGTINRNIVDPYGLAKLRLSAANMSSDDAVASLFVNLIFPGEGQVNLEVYRAAAKNWLNVQDDGTTPEFWNTMIDGAGNPGVGKEQRSDERLRGMVAFLMSLQRFNEQ